MRKSKVSFIIDVTFSYYIVSFIITIKNVCNISSKNIVVLDHFSNLTPTYIQFTKIHSFSSVFRLTYLYIFYKWRYSCKASFSSEFSFMIFIGYILTFSFVYLLNTICVHFGSGYTFTISLCFDGVRQSESDVCTLLDITL